jgi:hypothetical protein
MRHDETRENITAIEANMMAGDSAEEILVSLGHSPEAADRMVEERHPEHNDGANGYEEGSVAEALFGQRHFGGFKNLQGDGPSGFDYWHDTHRCL